MTDFIRNRVRVQRSFSILPNHLRPELPGAGAARRGRVTWDRLNNSMAYCGNCERALGLPVLAETSGRLKWSQVQSLLTTSRSKLYVGKIQPICLWCAHGCFSTKHSWVTARDYKAQQKPDLYRSSLYRERPNHLDLYRESLPSPL